MEDKMKKAKALMKIVKPYYNDETGKLNSNAPDKVREAYRQLDTLMDEIMKDPDLFDNRPYFADGEKEKEWTRTHKK